MKPNTKPKNRIQRGAPQFLRTTERLLKDFRDFRDSPSKTDENYAYSSSLRTLGRCVRGREV
jgi:hypothetical protein